MNIFLLVLAFMAPSVISYNYFIISPIFGYSHMKFMGKIADVLADAGHNVTFFQPILYDYYVHKKVTKNPNIETFNYEMDEEGKAAASDPSVFKFFWETKPSKNPFTGAKVAAGRLHQEFKHICRKMLTDKDLHKWITSKNFDSHISEAFDFCGLYLGDFLKLRAPIPLYSGVRCAPASHAIGEPSPLNYLPTEGSNYGPKSSTFDRINDMLGLSAYYVQFGMLFDMQYEQAMELTGGKVRTWQEILQTSTFFLTNSNPYLSFSTPTISKMVQIGGFTIDSPKDNKLDAEFDRILDLKTHTILVSFGTVIQSSDMPSHFKQGLIETFKKMPEVTFIWKYEGDDVEVQENVILSKWVPQPALLADKRLDVFVTHGGLGSTMEVAYAGVPSVMIPIFSDQGVNAEMLARHGGASVISKFDLSNSDKLVSTFQQILGNPNFKKRAELLSDILHSQPMDPKKTLLNHCEFSAKFGSIQNLEPFSNKYNFVEFYCLDVIVLVVFGISCACYIIYLLSIFVLEKMRVLSKLKNE